MAEELVLFKKEKEWKEFRDGNVCVCRFRMRVERGRTGSKRGAVGVIHQQLDATLPHHVRLVRNV